MTWILEEPIYILILGVLTLTFLGFAYTQTGYRMLMHAMLAVVALTGGLLLLENMVETNTEQMEATLETIARDVETNDLERILSHVSSEATDTYDLAQREFPRYHFDRVNIKNNVEVFFDDDRAPTQAKVTFNVTVDVQHKATGADYHVPRFVRVTLVKENGQWRVAEYTHDDPRNTRSLPFNK